MKTLNKALGTLAFLPMLLGSAALMAAPAYANVPCHANPSSVECSGPGNGQPGKPSPTPTATPSASASPSASPTPTVSTPAPTPSSKTATPTPSLVAPAPGDTPAPSETSAQVVSPEVPSTEEEISDQVGTAPAPVNNAHGNSGSSSSGGNNTSGNGADEVVTIESSDSNQAPAESTEEQIDVDQAASPNTELENFLYTLGAVVCLILAGVVLYLKISSDRKWKAAQNKVGRPKTPTPKNIQ